MRGCRGCMKNAQKPSSSIDVARGSGVRARGGLDSLNPRYLLKYCSIYCIYCSPPILRGFWDEKINRVKPRNWGRGRVKQGTLVVLDMPKISIISHPVSSKHLKTISNSNTVLPPRARPPRARTPLVRGF